MSSSTGATELTSFSRRGCPRLAHNMRPTKAATESGENVGAGASEEKDGEETPVESGMFLERKDLYRSDPRAEWGVWAPDDVGIDSKETAASAKFALIVKRDRIQEDNGSSALKLHSVQVQSPLIKALLAPVFANYPGIKTSLKKLKFLAPFREFFYRWKEFLEASKISQQDEMQAAHFKLLFDLISAEIQPHIEEVKDLVANEVINFAHLWAIFEPNMDVYSLVDGQHRLYRMQSAGYVELPGGAKAFRLSCQFIDTDAVSFGYNSTALTIGEFADVVHITDLTVIPAHIKPDIDTIRTKLAERGRKFELLKGCHYKNYSGDYVLATTYLGNSQKVNLRNGRIMVDDAMYDRYNKGGGKSLRPLNSLGRGRLDGSSGTIFDLFDLDDHDSHESSPLIDYMRRIRQRTKRQEARMQSQVARNSGTSLDVEHYAYCTSMVRGFCLTSKQWVSLYVDNILDISWNEEAFERLVLPHDYKRLIQAFVHTQLSAVDNFDDIMSGKGQGIIMLLSGEPGTGKTLTAESGMSALRYLHEAHHNLAVVAEVMRRPLYSIGAGELGESANEVENNLRRVLEISTKWNAVLLLDECDVFLEQRSAKSVERNKLVAVFLRLLEYYQGVMFLTTNRIDSHDAAFESRIHLTIQFSKLDYDSRLHVWKTFVRAIQGESKYASKIYENGLRELASNELNGRQIKNVVKTARLLAASEKQSLDISHVEAVLRVK